MKSISNVCVLATMIAAVVGLDVATAGQPSVAPESAPAAPAPASSAPASSAPASAPEQGGPRVDLRDLFIRRPVASGTKYALVVGVGEASYNGVAQTPLQVCRFDATAMGRVLRDLGFDCTVMTDSPGGASGGGPAQTLSLLPTSPNVAGVTRRLEYMRDSAGPDDTLLVYMSSHGGVIDGKPSVILTDGGIEVAKIKEMLAASKALVRIVMLDCCRGDAGFSPLSMEARDVHTISACAPDELSQTGISGLSVFTEAFVDGVTDCRADRVHDGVIELDEIVHYVAQEVPRRAAPGGKPQHPTRTVVDPKSINPVLGVCDAALASVPPETTAFAGPAVRIARNDWIYSSLLLQKATKGMTAEEVVAAMEREPSLRQLDAQGSGMMMFDDEPREGDALQVVFEAGKVSQVSTVFASMCEDEFDAAASRKAVLGLMGAEGLGALVKALEGKGVKEVIEAIGCPTAALVADTSADGSLRYLDVPRPTQMLVVVMTGGKASGAEIRVLE